MTSVELKKYFTFIDDRKPVRTQKSFEAGILQKFTSQATMLAALASCTYAVFGITIKRNHVLKLC